MKRRTSTLPVKVMNYGVTHRGIVTNRDLAEEQYRLAHAYSQKLVELELWRRAQVRALLNAETEIVPLVSDLAAVEAEMLSAQQAVKAVKAASRSRNVPAELKSRIQDLRTVLKEKRAALKDAKRASAGGDEVKAKLKEIDNQHKQAVREARALSGCFWGSYLAIEKAADQQRKSKTDPRFKPYDGSGRIVVQLQRGAPVPQVYGAAASDRRLQIVPITSRPPSKRADKIAHMPIRASRHMCRIRIGSNGRDPIWAEVEAIIHNPPPADGRVMWAWLHRVRRGREFNYRLQLTVEAESFRAISTGTKRIGVDLGWRVADKGAGGLRVAYWRDSSGQHGELRLPPKLISSIEYPEQLLGVETHWFEKAHAEYMKWRSTIELPIEHTMRTENVGQWRSAKRFASYVWWWREHRFVGDETMYALLEEWRTRRFWHYRQWSMHQRDQALAARKDFYRVFASVLTRDCAELVLEKFDLRTFAVKRDDVETPQRYWQRVAAPYELRLCLIAAAKGHGARITLVDPANTTRTCKECGAVEPEAIIELNHTCSKCGAVWDQDENAAVNILARGGGESAREEA